MRERLGEFFERNPLTSIVRHQCLKSDKLKTENKGFKMDIVLSTISLPTDR